MTALEAGLEENTTVTNSIKDDTSELVTIFRNLKGFNAVARFGVQIVLMAGALVVAVGILYWYFKTGDLPRK